MSKKLIRPTDIEEAQINAAALADPGNLTLTDNELQQFRRTPGRPQGSGEKEQVMIRIDAEILEQFRATGKGWKTCINDASRGDWIKQH